MKRLFFEQEMVRVNQAAQDINEKVKNSGWRFVCFFGREWDVRQGETDIPHIWALFECDVYT